MSKHPVTLAPPTRRRTMLLGLAAGALLTLAACSTPPAAAPLANDRHCHRSGRAYQPIRVCMPTAVPSLAVEAQAKRFEADPAGLTVYVLRRRWADINMLVPIDVDGQAVAATIPRSLVRLRLRAGDHQLSVPSGEQTVVLRISGQAGEVRFVELVGSAWVWGPGFSWKPSDLEALREPAMASRLVADLDLRT